jgi:hypothetical protein
MSKTIWSPKPLLTDRQIKASNYKIRHINTKDILGIFLREIKIVKYVISEK